MPHQSIFILPLLVAALAASNSGSKPLRESV